MAAAPATAGTESPRTLAECLAGRDNALNLVRLVLAITVIFGHAFPLGGFDALHAGPLMHAGWHGQAVLGFFGISGYLILGSALRMPLAPYLWRRFLRIYPGYLVAVVVTAFLLAPMGHLIDPRVAWDPGSAVGFVLQSLDLKVGTLVVSDDGAVIATGHSWNGSLWTLFYEGVAYLAVGLLTIIPALRSRIHLIGAVLAAVLTLLSAIPGTTDLLVRPLPAPLTSVVVAGLPLGAAFACGMVLHGLAERLPITAWRVATAGVALLFLLSVVGLPPVLYGLFSPALLAYVSLSAGALLPWRLGARNDLSYGVYVYAYPVQVLLVLLGVTAWGWLPTALACVVATLPLATASWWLVEKPSLRLTRLVPASPRAPLVSPRSLSA